MATINTDIYDAFKSAGVPEDKARAAAAAIPEQAELVTKADLKAVIAELETRLMWKMLALQGVTIALLKLIL